MDWAAFRAIYAKIIWSQCYDNNFWQFSAKKWRFSQKPML
jgi:hypothetical protein